MTNARVAIDRGGDRQEIASGNVAFRTLVESIPAVTYVRRAAEADSFVYLSPQVEELLGWHARDFVDNPGHWLNHVHPYDRAQIEAARSTADATSEPFLAEYRVVARDGRVIWLRDRALLAGGPAESALVWQGVLIDITADKDGEAHLHRLAFYDPLTGLPNRRLCIDRLQSILNQSDQANVALLFLDLDRFKIINDGIGHAAGDELLTAVARRLAPHIAARGSLARFGGDEFVAILEHPAGVQDVEDIAQTLLVALRQPFTVNGYDLIVGGTIGIAFSSPELNTPEALLRAADVALYRAKAHGGDTLAVFDPNRDHGGLERLEQEADMRRALERGEFQIAYQPVVDIASRQILAVEALLRWHHPDRGILPPAAFMPLAEETGLIVPLGQWVIEEACRQVRLWQQQYPSARSLQVSVNLSGRQFRQTALETDVARALGKTGLSPRSLALELKEGDALANATEIAATLKAFKRLGVKVTIDDFGKGWAALRSLTEFMIDDLKIDGSSVSRLGGEQKDIAIVRALVGMARAIGLDVTAGAVETDEELALMQELGCARAQGRHFSPPLTAEEMARLLGRDAEPAPGPRWETTP